MMEYDKTEHVKLAVHLLNECSKFQMSNQVVINALLLSMQDTLSTLPKEDRIIWFKRLDSIFNVSKGLQKTPPNSIDYYGH